MTYYEILQVIPSASPEVIRMAYKALAKKYHPDVFQGKKEYAEMKMKQINEAYSVLSSPTARQKYDKILQEKEEETKRSDYASQQKKQGSVQKKADLSTFWAIVVIIALSIVLLKLNGANAFDKNEYKDNNQAVASPTNNAVMQPPAVIIPRTGDILSGTECFDGSKLTITADSESSYVVKLKTSLGVERLSFYVRAGDTVTVGVPAEYLYVYFASGDTWYGKGLLFGEETFYSMDDELLDFTQYTWEYTLYPVTSGNFSETPIKPEDF